MNILNKIKLKTEQMAIKFNSSLDLYGYEIGALFGITGFTSLVTQFTTAQQPSLGITSLSLGLTTIGVLAPIFKATYDKYSLHNKNTEAIQDWKNRTIIAIDNNKDTQIISHIKFAELVLTGELDKQYLQIISSTPSNNPDKPYDLTAYPTYCFQTMDDVFTLLKVSKNSETMEHRKNLLDNILKEDIKEHIFSNISDLEKAEKLRSQIAKFNKNYTTEQSQTNLTKHKI